MAVSSLYFHSLRKLAFPFLFIQSLRCAVAEPRISLSNFVVALPFSVLLHGLMPRIVGGGLSLWLAYWVWYQRLSPSLLLELRNPGEDDLPGLFHFRVHEHSELFSRDGILGKHVSACLGPEDRNLQRMESSEGALEEARPNLIFALFHRCSRGLLGRVILVAGLQASLWAFAGGLSGDVRDQRWIGSSISRVIPELLQFRTFCWDESRGSFSSDRRRSLRLGGRQGICIG